MSKSYLTPNQVADLLMVSPTAVRQWAEKGDLKALTTPGGHRRFLPIEVENFAQTRGLTLNLTQPGQLRLMIVDDDVQLARYLGAFFGGFKDELTVEIVNDGFVAGLKVNEFQPDVILLDLMMPGLDGFEVCRLLKSSPSTRSIRIIAMTGFPSQENIDKIMAAGAELCLSKPIKEEELLSYIGLKQQLKI